MSFQDKSIRCSTCGTLFNFSAREQEFYASREYQNEPKHCSWCRAVKKLDSNERGHSRSPGRVRAGY